MGRRRQHHRSTTEAPPKDPSKDRREIGMKKAPQVAVLGGWLSLFVLPQRIEL